MYLCYSNRSIRTSSPYSGRLSLCHALHKEQQLIFISSFNAHSYLNMRRQREAPTSGKSITCPKRTAKLRVKKRTHRRKTVAHQLLQSERIISHILYKNSRRKLWSTIDGRTINANQHTRVKHAQTHTHTLQLSARLRA